MKQHHAKVKHHLEKAKQHHSKAMEHLKGMGMKVKEVSKKHEKKKHEK